MARIFSMPILLRRLSGVSTLPFIHDPLFFGGRSILFGDYGGSRGRALLSMPHGCPEFHLHLNGEFSRQSRNASSSDHLMILIHCHSTRASATDYPTQIKNSHIRKVYLMYISNFSRHRKSIVHSSLRRDSHPPAPTTPNTPQSQRKHQ